MLGAIIGDIIGSRFEFRNCKSKSFELFDNDCSFTDDSVMSIAIAKSILDCNNNYNFLYDTTVKNMQALGRLYTHRGYGDLFEQWIYSETPSPYNSYGNGAAMRVSPCGFAATSLEGVKALSYSVTATTHNHPDGIKGAEAAAVAVFLAKQGYDKSYIGDYIHTNYYKLYF